MSLTANNRNKQKSNPAGRGATKRAPNGFMYERARIEAGLKKLGISGGCEIVVPDNPDIVETTAAETLQKFLGNGRVGAAIVPESKSTGKKRFLLGRESNHKAIKKLGNKGELHIRDVSPEDDGFHLKRIGQDFVVAGANPRGVLYGVYTFEEFVHTGAEGGLDIKHVPYYRKRGSGPYYSFNFYINLSTEDFPEEKAACLSRLRINQLTDQGVGGYLEHFVQSDVFPFQTPPKPDFQRKVKAMSVLCKKYGIEMYLFVAAPAHPREAGGLEHYPREALGTVKRPWGGGPDGLDDTLCVSSPMVQKHLRHMMRKLVREYPDVKGVQFYNMDGGSWICTPALCDRCKAVCTDSPQAEFNPWETQAKLITLLAEAAHAENPGFDFRFWGAVHYHGERFDKMIRAARGYTSLLNCWNGSDRSVMVPDSAKPDTSFVTSRAVCGERAVPFHAIFEFNNIESVPRSLPFPFHVCDALKKFERWGVKNLTEIYGLIPEHNSINALVTREFQCNPDQNPEAFLSGLALRQFGETAGKWVYRAWEEMERAFDAWNDMEFGPLDGSQHILSIGTPVALPPPILPEIVMDRNSWKNYDKMLAILTNVEPWRADGYRKFKELAFLDKMNLMNRHLAQAAALAKKAVSAASDKEFIGICHYAGPNGRPTRKEYAELNHASIAIADAICRQRCHMLRAYHLLTEIENARADDDEKSARAKGRLYHDLIREDIGVQEQFCTLLMGFAGMRPCYTRTSLTEHEISDLLTTTLAKINTLKTFPGMKPATF